MLELSNMVLSCGYYIYHNDKSPLLLIDCLLYFLIPLNLNELSPT